VQALNARAHFSRRAHPRILREITRILALKFEATLENISRLNSELLNRVNARITSCREQSSPRVTDYSSSRRETRQATRVARLIIFGAIAGRYVRQMFSRCCFPGVQRLRRRFIDLDNGYTMTQSRRMCISVRQRDDKEKETDR